MKPPGRPWIWIGAALLAVVALTAVLQAVNALIWQLSYLLPSWLVGPALLLLFVAVRMSGELVVPDAHRWILNLFAAFELGTFGLWLPGVLVVAVLVIWHSIERHPWKADGTVIGLMWSESIVLALPLMVFSQASLRIPAAPAASALGAEAGASDAVIAAAAAFAAALAAARVLARAPPRYKNQEL